MEGVGAHLPPPRRVVVLDKVTDFLLFLGKLLIVGGVGAWGPSGTQLGLWGHRKRSHPPLVGRGLPKPP